MATIQGSNRRVLQKRKTSSRDWTKARRAIFLAELEASCNVTRAAQAAGMAKRAVYELRRREPSFATLWAEALDAGVERLRAELLARALGTSGPDDENPDREDIVARAPEAMSDEMRLRVLQACRRGDEGRPARGRRAPVRLDRSADEAIDALLAKLDRVEKRLGRGA